jgi:hypothetical protein
MLILTTKIKIWHGFVSVRFGCIVFRTIIAYAYGLSKDWYEPEGKIPL